MGNFSVAFLIFTPRMPYHRIAFDTIVFDDDWMNKIKSLSNLYVYIKSPNPQKKQEGSTPQAPRTIKLKPQPQKPNSTP